jgi:predicted negative regulator of RcsB-dependent stress response
MKAIQLLVIVCLVVIAAVAGRYLYKNSQSENHREAAIKEDEANKRTLSESSKRISEERRKLLEEAGR